MAELLPERPLAGSGDIFGNVRTQSRTTRVSKKDGKPLELF